jgi:SAM-dependent methyltransferase
MGSTETGRVAPWVAPARPSVVGPPSPVRRSKSGESGERVTEPAAREPPTATGLVRLARCPLTTRPLAASRMLQAPGVSPRFLDLLAQEPLGRSRVLDVGCGAGRLSLALAPASKWVVGLDRDAPLIQEARRRAAAAGLTNVEFHEADVEADPYEPWRPDLVTAHLCASDAIIERAGRALAPGACLAMVAFHVDQWKETGKVSRFAYNEARMHITLEAHGFAVEALEVEQDVRRFDSVEEGLAAAVGLEDRWKADGRWFRYIAFLESGGRTLTRSHLLVKARLLGEAQPPASRADQRSGASP